MFRELAILTLVQLGAPTEYDRARGYIDTREYVLAASERCGYALDEEGLKILAKLRAVEHLDLSDKGPLASYIAMKRATFKQAFTDDWCSGAFSEYGRHIRTNAYSMPALLRRR